MNVSKFAKYFSIQNVKILLGGCLTVKNWWGLLTGDDGVGFGGLYPSIKRLIAILTWWL